ncbi:hypothetical protein L9F63_000123, partial [Diploptera punctata]
IYCWNTPFHSSFGLLRDGLIGNHWRLPWKLQSTMYLVIPPTSKYQNRILFYLSIYFYFYYTKNCSLISLNINSDTFLLLDTRKQCLDLISYRDLRNNRRLFFRNAGLIRNFRPISLSSPWHYNYEEREQIEVVNVIGQRSLMWHIEKEKSYTNENTKLYKRKYNRIKKMLMPKIERHV